MKQNLIWDVLEIFFNETDDLDIIADRCDVDILTVANIINNWRAL